MRDTRLDQMGDPSGQGLFFHAQIVSSDNPWGQDRDARLLILRGGVDPGLTNERAITRIGTIESDSWASKASTTGTTECAPHTCGRIYIDTSSSIIQSVSSISMFTRFYKHIEREKENLT
jgi:hypothetical protein